LIFACGNQLVGSHPFCADAEAGQIRKAIARNIPCDRAIRKNLECSTMMMKTGLEGLDRKRNLATIKNGDERSFITKELAKKPK
jgi:hypothetical protein